MFLHLAYSEVYDALQDRIADVVKMRNLACPEVYHSPSRRVNQALTVHAVSMRHTTHHSYVSDKRFWFPKAVHSAYICCSQMIFSLTGRSETAGSLSFSVSVIRYKECEKCALCDLISLFDGLYFVGDIHEEHTDIPIVS